MYGPQSGVKRRETLPVERAVDCPTCEAEKGQACVVRGADVDTGEHAGTPHNLRYRAAGIDPWA